MVLPNYYPIVPKGLPKDKTQKLTFIYIYYIYTMYIYTIC